MTCSAAEDVQNESREDVLSNGQTDPLSNGISVAKTNSREKNEQRTVGLEQREEGTSHSSSILLDHDCCITSLLGNLHEMLNTAPTGSEGKDNSVTEEN